MTFGYRTQFTQNSQSTLIMNTISTFIPCSINIIVTSSRSDTHFIASYWTSSVTERASHNQHLGSLDDTFLLQSCPH